MERILAVVGPTAAGKSELALALAQELDGEIVNADALQVYRGFDIGTAKPGAAARRSVPHHLIDILEPAEPYSAGEFARRARGAIAEIRARHRLPIVVGGSGLYLRALMRGISPLPPADPDLRAALRGRLRRQGLEALRSELAELDPATEERLAAGDTQRVLRALEVALSTGRPLSEWIARRPFGEAAMPALWAGLTLPRPILYDRIAARARRMIETGWVSEVASLLDRGLDVSLPAFQAIGYREIARHVQGEWSLEEALESTVRATRRFAKRQMTWFQREEEILWFSSLEPDAARARIRTLLHREN